MEVSLEQQEILTFWFGNQYPKNVPIDMQKWFSGSPELNKEIVSRFSNTVQRAVKGHLNGWCDQGPHSCLALIILLDQFSLNIGRERKDTYGFESSRRAIPFSYTAIGRGFIPLVPQAARMFFLLPLEHSELLVDQDICVEQHIKYGIPAQFAEQHRDAIRQFGRFPNRNELYGRSNTPEEDQYLTTFSGWTGKRPLHNEKKDERSAISKWDVASESIKRRRDHEAPRKMFTESRPTGAQDSQKKTNDLSEIIAADNVMNKASEFRIMTLTSRDRLHHHHHRSFLPEFRHHQHDFQPVLFGAFLPLIVALLSAMRKGERMH